MTKNNMGKHFILIISPCIIWLTLLNISTPWWLENLLSTPLIIVLIALILLVIVIKYVSSIQFFVHLIANLCIAIIINNVQFFDENPHIKVSAKNESGCNNSKNFFQFNMKFNNNEKDIDKLVDYLIKDDFELITLQGVPQQEKGTLIKKLQSAYPYHIRGEKHKENIITDQLIFSRHSFKNITYHIIDDTSPLISSDWLVPVTSNRDNVKLKTINLYTLHPPSPRNKKLWETRNTVLNKLNQDLMKKKLNTLENTTIVIGDLNLPKNTERIRYIDNLMHTIHINSWPNYKYLSTVFGIAIDHFWISKTAHICSRDRIDRFNGSDHYAIKTKILGLI